MQTPVFSSFYSYATEHLMRATEVTIHLQQKKPQSTTFKTYDYENFNENNHDIGSSFNFIGELICGMAEQRMA